MELDVQPQPTTPSAPPPQVPEPTTEVQETKTEYTSFDDLDSIVTDLKSKPQPEKKVEAKGDDEAQEGSKEDSQKESKDNAKKVQKALQKWKAYRGEDKMELFGDTMVELKIDGKIEQVPLDEALRTYSGNKGFEKKFSAFNLERQKFESERKSMNENVDRVYKMAVEEKNPRGAIEYLAELMGADPNQVYENMRKQIESQDAEFADLSPEERRIKELERELAWQKNREQSRHKDAQKAKERTVLQQRVDKVMTDHGLTNEQFVSLYNELKSSGRVNEAEITPELVGHYNAQIKRQTDISSLVEEAKLDPEDALKAGRDLFDVWTQNPKLSLDDIKEILIEVYGGKAAKNLSRKVKSAKPVNTARPTPARSREPVLFDDIDDM